MLQPLQGIGAALLVPCSLALLTHVCRGDATTRGRAIRLWTATASISLAAGPVIGGMLIDTFGWRSIFLINLPIGAAIEAGRLGFGSPIVLSGFAFAFYRSQWRWGCPILSPDGSAASLVWAG